MIDLGSALVGATTLLTVERPNTQNRQVKQINVIENVSICSFQFGDRCVKPSFTITADIYSAQ